MERAIAPRLLADLTRKAVLLSGPRQCGKTTLARMLTADHDYLNFDYPEHRLALRERSWDRRRQLVVLDELHKMEGWKAWLKGIIDVEPRPPAFLVTGSARLEDARRSGDSLAGRYFHHRLHPFDVRELAGQGFAPEAALARLLELGGFPEPWLENDAAFYNRWRRTHTDAILRQDLVDMAMVGDIHSIETLLELLRHRVGSPVSYASLARDLARDPKTVRRWCDLLEALYVVFAVRPWHRNIARAILKEPKYYFYDTGQVAGDEGARLENLVACALLKEAHRLEDTGTVASATLQYIRAKDGREIDFAVARNGHLSHLVEVKVQDDTLSPNFRLFPEGETVQRIQLVRSPSREKTFPGGEQVLAAADWLARLDLGES